MKTITTLAALFAAVLSFNAAAAVPQTGRVDFSDRAGIERPMEVKYLNGRVAPEATKGIWSHKGRSVSNGRQG
jgi:hypothetical protein